MKEIAKMRIGLIKEVRKLIKFFEEMEKGIKSRDPGKIYPAYVYISTLAHHMSEGDLTPLSIQLKQALLHDEHKRESEYEQKR